MALSTVGKRERELLELLGDDKVRRIILLGESGIGKTWTARRLTNIARKKGIVEVAFWIPASGSYDKNTLWDCIVDQYLPLTAGESTDEKANESKNEEKQKLQIRIAEELSKVKKILLVFDDEGNEKSGTSSENDLKTMLKLGDLQYKVLIISRNRLGSNATEVGETSQGLTSGHVTEVDGEFETTNQGLPFSIMNMKPLLEEETLSLLEERAGVKVQRNEDFTKLIFAKTGCLPAAILLMAKSLSYFSQKDGGVQMLKQSLEEVPDHEIYSIRHLLQRGYELQPKELQPIRFLIDCCCPDTHFYRDCGRTHYMELIAYWMLEGYLGHVDSVEKAYEKGYQILMELLDCQILKKVEGDYVIMEGADKDWDELVMANEILNLDNCYRRGFSGTASLGLANVLGNDKGEVLRRKNRFSFSLIDGKGSSRQFVSSSFQSLEELHVIASFNTTHETLSLSSYGKLLPLSSNSDKSPDPYVLVFRGCHFLEKVDLNSKFDNLTVLEISGPSPLNTIPENFFEHTPKLESLNLSAHQITSLPLSLYELSELRWLILRDCPRLEKLKSIKKCKNLMVLDLSGAKSLDHIEDKIFAQNTCLQMLNFSQTKIRRFPIVNRLPKLTHLLLRDCKELIRLPFINGIKTLQVLDLSGSSKVEELKDRSLEELINLVIVDLSATAVINLPCSLGNPCHLSLKDCAQLNNLAFIESLKAVKVLDVSNAPFETLPSLSQLSNLRRLSFSCCRHLAELPDWNSLEKLEELDLSGCIALTTLRGTSFEKLSCLRSLDLSETTIKSLPSFSYLTNLCRLLLKKCIELEGILQLESLSMLKELNLCGVKCLGDTETGADFLRNMSQLQILDLSETPLQQLPSLSNLINLCQLYLRDCLALKKVDGLEELTKIEVLDLSGTSVDPSSYIANFTKLRQLLLSDHQCLQKKKMHHQLQSSFKEPPRAISQKTHLEHLDQSILNATQGAGSSKEEEPNQYNWAISCYPVGTDETTNKLPLSVSGSRFLELLEEDPSVWERFHFSIHPIKEPDRKGCVSFNRDDFLFMDIYCQSKKISDFEGQQPLEIYGFCDQPKGLKDVLGHAESVYFFDNAFEKWSSVLGTSNLKMLKGCWVERCPKMESVLCDEEAGESERLGNLNLLWVSNCVNLNHIYGGNWQTGTFQNLNRLYIDCCQQLAFVFSSSQLPISLQVLHIKFCDNLKSVFEPPSTVPLLPNLETLHLWDLPMLEKIGCGLPNLKPKIWECPKLEEFKDCRLERL